MTASRSYAFAMVLTLGCVTVMLARPAPASAASKKTKTVEAKAVDAPLALEAPSPAKEETPEASVESDSQPGSGSGLRLSVTPTVGWIRTWDAATSPTLDTDLSTGAGMFVWGISASVAPWRQLWLDVAFLRAGTQVDAPSGYVPLDPDITWTRLQLGAGWTLHPEGWGPIRSLKVGGGYNLEMFHSDEQTPSQLTPTWTHHDFVLRGRATTRMMNDALEAGVELGLVPFMVVTEQHGNSSGNKPFGLGFDVEAQAAYRVVQISGGGDIFAGAEIGCGYRRVQFHGREDRRSPNGVERLLRVLSSFHRLTMMLTVTWRYPGGAGSAASASTDGGGDGGGDEVEARLVGSRIEMGRPVHFKSGSSEIDMGRSRRALSAVARLFKRHPEITKVEVVGHTDDRGTAEENLDLSQRRARAVVEALIDRGVDESRLSSRGMGATKPVAKNVDDKGRAANRRVEFEILERTGGDS